MINWAPFKLYVKDKKMKLKLYQIDAFATKVFEGNPAAVCPLDEWLDETIMQNIAMENNLAETAFFVKNGDKYDIRWFTPNKEVNLCGHATLATAYVIFNILNHSDETITFDSKSGLLHVGKNAQLISMDFPAEPPVPCTTPQAIIDAFGKKPVEVLKSVDYIVVFDENEDLEQLTPDLDILKKLDLRGVCITAKDKKYDFVSRFFAPKYGINEDHVTGSAYTQLMPYWYSRLKQNILSSKQLSSRGGELHCELRGDRVNISGTAVLYLNGEIEIYK